MDQKSSSTVATTTYWATTQAPEEDKTVGIIVICVLVSVIIISIIIFCVVKKCKKKETKSSQSKEPKDEVEEGLIAPERNNENYAERDENPSKLISGVRQTPTRNEVNKKWYDSKAIPFIDEKGMSVENLYAA